MTGIASPSPWPVVNYYPGHTTVDIPWGRPLPSCDTCGQPATFGTKAPGKNPHHGVELLWCSRCYNAAAEDVRAVATDWDMAIGLDPAPAVITTYRRPPVVALEV